MLVSESHAVTEVMLTWLLSCAATWVHGDIQTLATAKDHVLVYGPAAAVVCDEVHDPPMLPPGATRRPGSGVQSVVLLESGGHAAARAMQI